MCGTEPRSDFRFGQDQVDRPAGRSLAFGRCAARVQRSRSDCGFGWLLAQPGSRRKGIRCRSHCEASSSTPFSVVGALKGLSGVREGRPITI